MKIGYVIALCIAVLLFGCAGGLAIGAFFGMSSVVAKEAVAEYTASARGDGSPLPLLAEPENVVITVEHPGATLDPEGNPVVSVGQEFDLIVRVKDTSGLPRQIGDIDIMSSLLDSFNVVSVSPEPASPADFSDEGWHYFTLAAQVQPNGEAIVTFRLKATTPGSFGGQIDVGVDERMKSMRARIVVVPER